MRTTQQVQKTTNKEAGVTLMELIAALAVMAVIIVGALALYSSATTSQASTQLVQDVMALRAGVKQLWMGQGDYSGISNTVLKTSGKVPTTLKGDGSTAFTHTSGATVDVDVGTSSSEFTMTVDSLSQPTCVALALSAQDWVSIKIGDEGAITAFPVTPAQATTGCADATGNTIVFTGS